MHALLLALFLQGPVDTAVGIVMRSQHVAGLSLGIAQRGRTIYMRGYGDRDTLRHLPAQPQTVYRIGSLTKMFTARALETLAARQKIGLDLPVARYLPDFPWGAGVSVRDLLVQRSGIPSYTDRDALNRYAWYSPEELLASVSAQPLQFEPGSQFAYSNTNYVLLGMIVQRAARMPFEDYVDGRVIAPLHLHHTRYGDQPDEALGYTWDGRAFARATPSSPAYAFSAAALSSNVPDLLRFLDTLRAPYYGLLQSERLGARVWYASGNVDGYSAFALTVPETGDEAVILCNADKVDLAPLALDVLAAMAPQAPPDGFGPAQNEDPRVTAQIKQRASALLAPLTVTLVEFLGRETGGQASVVVYRVTLSDGTRVLLRAPVAADGSLGEISITPL
ncbi:MAG TPA: serine hydrolase domain-containing protein [Candidatus Baltobacteraceae bacterium]|nr:serine hydrolase domain-containing protein [Candidatus Baltobacteraceae bacterium]